jgi:hypothetical protein
VRGGNDRDVTNSRPFHSNGLSDPFVKVNLNGKEMRFPVNYLSISTLRLDL